MINSVSRFKALEPHVFKTNEESDPKEWLDRYDLYSRRMQWSKEDKIEILEIYLDRKEIMWFKNMKHLLKNWNKTKSEFIEKFFGKESEIKAWVALQEFKLDKYEDMDEFEMVLNSLISKTKISDKKVKWRCLMASLSTKYQKLILRNKISEFEKAIMVVRDGIELYKLVDTHKYIEDLDENLGSKSEKVIVKSHVP
ncbi:hypothetical protein AYI68_g5106 [Smittium mucronatum]|uniref:Retrotransposon gag domain-containing protein n=1 Tax=Smittium mucronatum TaxID=133383 RepID=A0A1R0GV98_9FUNG|nr:hypothetical protein AYI68_g5106 [Smittium mucronatum]